MGELQLEGRMFYDIPALSERMGVGIQTIRMYVRTGKLKAVRIGRKYWIDEKELVKIFAQGTGEPVKMPKKDSE